MRLPRDLSGSRLIDALCRDYGYRRVHQVGSHVILETDTPAHHRIAIPNHESLRIGTLNSILRSVAAAQRIDKKEILRSL
jgi:predicted RNA binding protein YcfA (HicA-like mRNA interferase family)